MDKLEEAWQHLTPEGLVRLTQYIETLAKCDVRWLVKPENGKTVMEEMFPDEDS